MYNKVASELGIDIAALANKEFSLDEKLPWDDINYGVDKSWLKAEYNKAKEENTSVPCEVKCNNCGVCKNLATHKVLDN